MAPEREELPISVPLNPNMVSKRSEPNAPALVDMVSDVDLNEHRGQKVIKNERMTAIVCLIERDELQQPSFLYPVSSSLRPTAPSTPAVRTNNFYTL
jgi:hypothetical protein